MGWYTKRSETIEAVRWEGYAGDGTDAPKLPWPRHWNTSFWYRAMAFGTTDVLAIPATGPTANGGKWSGDLLARPGDYVCRRSDGSFFVVQGEAFRKEWVKDVPPPMPHEIVADAAMVAALTAAVKGQIDDVASLSNGWARIAIVVPPTFTGDVHDMIWLSRSVPATETNSYVTGTVTEIAQTLGRNTRMTVDVPPGNPAPALGRVRISPAPPEDP